MFSYNSKEKLAKFPKKWGGGIALPLPFPLYFADPDTLKYIGNEMKFIPQIGPIFEHKAGFLP